MTFCSDLKLAAQWSLDAKHLHLYLADFLAWFFHKLALVLHLMARSLIHTAEFCYLWMCGCLPKPSDDQLQVSRILLTDIDSYFVPFQTEMRISMKHFATWHQSFENLEYLQNICVCLCYVGDQYVYFLEVDEKDVNDLYDTRKYPFFEVGLWKLAKKFIQVPKKAFLEYSAGLGKIKANVVYCAQSSRCGSTALAQAINNLKGWTVIAEISWQCDLIPDSLSTYEEVKEYATSQEFKTIAAACIKAQLSIYPEGSNVFWKANNFHESWILRVINEFFPEIKLIFMTRKGNKSSDSFMKAYPRNMWFDFILYCYNLMPEFFLRWSADARSCRYAFTHGLLTPELHKFITNGRLTLWEIMWLRTVCEVALFKQICTDIPLLLIEYDAYICDLKAGLTRVFDYMGIPASNLQDALDSYQYQSQAGSIYSGHPRAEIYGIYGRDGITEAKCQALTVKLGIPGFQELPTKKHFVSDKWTYLMFDGKKN